MMLKSDEKVHARVRDSFAEADDTFLFRNRVST